jgi:predicted lipoprotein
MKIMKKMMTMVSSARLFVCASLLSACGGGAAPVDPDFVSGEAARRVVLADMADGVILPTLRGFSAASDALVAATEALAARPEDEMARSAARAAWVAAMELWQVAEVMQIGPAGPASDDAGGLDLRDRIYAWPVINACRVDQETLAESYREPTAVAARAANIRGLAALEHLLFAPDARNACPQNAEINTSGAWDALGQAEVATRRAAHAHALSRDLAGLAATLRDAWEPGAGDFRGAFAEAGVATAPFPTAQEALNHVSDALFYIDKEVKDLKIGTPLGYFSCAADTCPERFESRASLNTRANLAANLRGFRLLFSGADTSAAARANPRNFQALLVAAGASPLADAMLDAADGIDARLDAIRTDMESALANDPAQAEALYEAVKGLTDLLKTQFVGTLDLDLPNRAEGDND